MKKLNFICAALLCVFMALANCMSAQTVPFRTTTLTGSGEFADDTPWYTMTIGANSYAISYQGNVSYMSLGSKLETVTDNDLWCFVGDDTNGYHIYNKAAGPDKMLAAPTTMQGTTGSGSYPNLLATTEAESNGNTATWMFSSSSDIADAAGLYMYEKGYESNKVNNRSGVLAFWTGGQDAGSTIVIKFAQQRVRINMDYGTFTSSNGAKTYHAVWTSNQTEPQYSFSVAKNNMDTTYTRPELRLYNGNASSYTVQVGSGYQINSFELDFSNFSSSENMTLTCGTYAATAQGSETAHLSVPNVNDVSASIIITSASGSNGFVCTDNFYVNIGPGAETAVQTSELFITKSGGIPYRIPAIATAQNGDLIAISDYRYCGADIGNGRIDLHQRISTDNGVTWGTEQVVVSGDGVLDSRGRNYSLSAGYGDACIVADRESSEVLMMSVCGYQVYTNGTRDVPNPVARFRSHDNGQTWSEPEYVTELFYSKFDTDCTRGPINSMFIGSGKIHQSRYVKVGQYYRLYCSTLTKDVNKTECNYVWYSDDFGETWEVLGNKNNPAIPSGANEPKTEELPDGSVVVSSRMNGGRYFNIFKYTNVEKAEGSWMTYATSNSSNNGVSAVSNSCNGEIMMVPARRKSDNKAVYVALQSVPFGSGRANVGIYYKEIASLQNDCKDPATFAKNWDGRKQISSLGSAYSTMCQQQNGNIAFLFEENTYTASYTIVFRSLTLEEITNDAYTYDPSVSAEDFGLVKVTYILMEGDRKVDETVVQQEVNSDISIPESWIVDGYEYKTEGTIGTTDCVITVTRTMKPTHTKTVKNRVAALEVGKNYAIFNTAINGSENRYGFYYPGNSTSLYCKLALPSELNITDTYLWTVEDAGNGLYAFKSVSTGSYISHTQRTLSTTPAGWDVQEWTSSTEAHSSVNSLNANETVTTNANLTADDRVFTVVNPDGTDRSRCWNGNTYASGDKQVPALWSNCHPFAFYEIKDVEFIFVTYIVMEGGEEVTRMVVEQEPNSGLNIPAALYDTEFYYYNIEGTVGSENSVITLTRTRKESAEVVYEVVDKNGYKLFTSDPVATAVGNVISDLPEEYKKDYTNYNAEPLTIKAGSNKFVVTATFDLPFQTFTDFATAPWYKATIRTDYYLCVDDSEPYYPTSTYQDADNFKWTFAGNPYEGIKIYNKSTGEAQTLGLSSAMISGVEKPTAVMQYSETVWDILKNGDGFVFQLPGKENYYMNQNGGVNGYLGFWIDSKGRNDDGSTWRVEQVDATGLETIDTTAAASQITYDLQGRRVSKTQKGGLYIINRKKVLVK
ncbi:MAG: exo-alpha-sialidase [Bacteroidaceae bacterium]|nr:exo-alpha-sialidase [Bacteroidaceae bacterium]